MEVHVIFNGRVQGVFFRATAQEIANEMHLVGSVRNLPDGTVELYAQGSKDELLELMRRLESRYNLDPVSSTTATFKGNTNRFESFQILY